MKLMSHGRRAFWSVFFHMLWKNWRKRGNRFRAPFSRENLVIAWRMAGCAKVVVDGPPYPELHLRWRTKL